MSSYSTKSSSNTSNVTNASGGATFPQVKERLLAASRRFRIESEEIEKGFETLQHRIQYSKKQYSSEVGAMLKRIEFLEAAWLKATEPPTITSSSTTTVSMESSASSASSAVNSGNPKSVASGIGEISVSDVDKAMTTALEAMQQLSKEEIASSSLQNPEKMISKIKEFLQHKAPTTPSLTPVVIIPPLTNGEIKEPDHAEDQKLTIQDSFTSAEMLRQDLLPIDATQATISAHSEINTAKGESSTHTAVSSPPPEKH